MFANRVNIEREKKKIKEIHSGFVAGLWKQTHKLLKKLEIQHSAHFAAVIYKQFPRSFSWESTSKFPVNANTSKTNSNL